MVKLCYASTTINAALCDMPDYAQTTICQYWGMTTICQKSNTIDTGFLSTTDRVNVM